MAFNTHVFISYSHGDNVEPGGQGWVSRFHELLEGFLTSRLKRTKAVIWRDKRLSDNDVFDPVIMEQLPDSAVFVAVLSDNYVESKWCQREAEAFCKAASESIGLAPDHKSRIFKVVKLPPERQDSLPAPMRETLGTNFFVRVDKDAQESRDEHDQPLPLDPSFGTSFAAKLNLRVSLLAADIVNTLKVIDRAGTAAGDAAPAAVARPTVYLAECGDDRREDREALRSELVTRGYPVLPNRELPKEDVAYRAEVTRLLERSALSIHLLGASPGPVPDGEGEDSVVVIQNALAVARAHAASLARVVSLPAGTVSKRARHQQFLEAMHRDAELQFGADLITADLESVKAGMQAALRRLEAPPPPAPAEPSPDAGASAPTIFVIFDRADLKATANLRKSLATRFRVLKPVFTEQTAGEMRKGNEGWLASCDVVLVYYGSGSDAWKASVDSELLKAPALRGGRPFRAVFTWLAAPSTDDKDDLVDTGGPAVIDARNGESDALLAPVFDALDGRHDG